MTVDQVSLQTIVCLVGVALSVVCFWIYWGEVKAALDTKPTAAANSGMAKAAQALPAAITVDESVKLLEAIAKVVDSLAKAGPALTSLVGAILFLLIAALSGGMLHAPRDHAPATAPAGQSAPAK